MSTADRERNAAILAARMRGATWPAIAEEHGVSLARVRQIANAEAAREYLAARCPTPAPAGHGPPDPSGATQARTEQRAGVPT